VVLAQSAAALPGLVDTAVMGRFGTAVDLAAVAVAAVAFSFLYWGFGFLRMSTTGLTAQALGAGQADAARATLLRGLTLAGMLGVALWVAFPVLRSVALWAFGAEPAVETGSASYMDARIFGAPAALMGFVLNGWMLGMGRTRALLAYQVFLNGSNAALDTGLVVLAGMGPAGIGAGTAIAEWLALGVGLLLVREGLRGTPGLLDRAALSAMFSANRDVMIRTLALLFAFAWFVNAGTRVDTATVAGNQVLLQFIAVSAFVLDGFAFIAEREVGEAVGASDPERLVRAIRVTTELAVAFGAVFAAVYWFAGGPVIDAFVADPAARASARAFLPFCAAVPLLGVAAWQLDGVFLGATSGRALRIAAVVSTGLYIALDQLLLPWGNTGIWWAFLASYAFRAGALGMFLPGLLRTTEARGS